MVWISAHPLVGEPIEGVTLTLMSNGRPTPMRVAHWLRTVSRELAKARPNVVHVHSLGTYAMLALGIPSDVPVVATPWGSDLITDLTTPWRRAIVRRAVRRARVFTCDAEHMRPRLVALGANSANVHIINFGIETKRYSAVAERRHGRPLQAASIHVPLRIVSLRNLDPVYDHPTLLRAVATLKVSGVPVSVKMYGAGPEQTRLQGLVAELGLGQTVTFCGRYSPVTLPDILEEADIYVSTSTSDAGIAASTAEAMAAGLPVVVSNSGDNEGWIEDGVNGRLFSVGDDASLARIMAEVALQPSEARRWGAAGRETIRQRNDYDTEMRKVEGVYASLLRP